MNEDIVNVVSNEDYRQKKDYFLKIYNNCRQFYFPRIEEYEYTILNMFSRSNHQLVRRIQRWKCGRKTLTLLAFKRAKVVFEDDRKKKYVYCIMPKSIDLTFKSQVIMKIFSSCHETKEALKIIKDKKDSQVIAIGWKKYSSRKRDVDFKTYMKENFEILQQEVPK